MRIVCPGCSAAYEVPDQLLAPGKRLRCARCGHEWLPAGPAFEALPPPVAEPAAPPPPISPPLPPPPRPEPVLHVEPAERPLPQPRPRSSVGAVLLTLIVSAAILAGIVAGVVQQRHRLMAIWPPSERLFQLLKLD